MLVPGGPVGGKLGIGGEFDREIWPQCGAFDIIYLGRARVKVHFPCAFLVSCLQLRLRKVFLFSLAPEPRLSSLQIIFLINNFFLD